MKYNILTKKIARKINLSEKKVNDALICFTKFMNDELLKGNQVMIKGMGTFETVEKSERKVFNPTNKKYTLVPKKSTIKFKPTNSFKNFFKVDL